ncbi:ZN182 protein, partial [Calcarius ornatus]|nr:ZN182 protein [Calcarius ornatus]
QELSMESSQEPLAEAVLSGPAAQGEAPGEEKPRRCLSRRGCKRRARGAEGERASPGHGGAPSSELGLHGQRQGGEEKPHKCSECGKSFRWKCKLIDHCTVHTRERPYSCGVCGKSFMWRSNLIKHCKSHTEQQGKKPTLGQRSKLGVHEQLQDGEKPHKCSECGKSFRWRSCLIIHQRIHTRGQLGSEGEKP